MRDDQTIKSLDMKGRAKKESKCKQTGRRTGFSTEGTHLNLPDLAWIPPALYLVPPPPPPLNPSHCGYHPLLWHRLAHPHDTAVELRSGVSLTTARCSAARKPYPLFSNSQSFLNLKGARGGQGGCYGAIVPNSLYILSIPSSVTLCCEKLKQDHLMKLNVELWKVGRNKWKTENSCRPMFTDTEL